MPEPTETPPVETPGQEPGAETPPESPQLPAEPTTPPETPPEPPPEAPPKPLSEEDILHKTQSWTGRKLAEFKDELIGTIREMMPQGGGAPTPDAPDPSQDADAWFEHKLTEKVKAEQKYNEKLYKSGMTALEQDPAVQADATLKDEIVQEVQSGRVPINRQFDPQTAANVAVAMAKANILTRRITQPKNPLDGNSPSSVPKGGVTPPETPPTPPVQVPQMSTLAKRMAEKWGYTPEEQAKILKGT